MALLDDPEAYRCVPARVREEAIVVSQLPESSLRAPFAAVPLPVPAPPLERRAAGVLTRSGSVRARVRARSAAHAPCVESRPVASCRSPIGPRESVAHPTAVRAAAGAIAVARLALRRHGEENACDEPSSPRWPAASSPGPPRQPARHVADAETSALVDLLDDALAHGTEGITHRRRWPRRHADEPDETLLPAGRAGRAVQGRSAPLLSRRRAGDPAAPRRTAGGADALPGRRGREGLLRAARTGTAAVVGGHLHDVDQAAEGADVPPRRERRHARLGREPRRDRAASVVRALFGADEAGLPRGRSRSNGRDAIRQGPRRRRCT